MAAEVSGLLPRGALVHPAFDPLRPWLDQLDTHPGVDRLNALAGALPHRPRTDGGSILRFTTPVSGAVGHYEQRILETGTVDTRSDNLHDLFNALAWLAFPKTKAALNARHVERLASEGNVRGSLRDLLTLIDEGGVIVACTPGALAPTEDLVRRFRWKQLFWEFRERLLEQTRFVLVGHSAYEKALTPYPGITCKAFFIPASRELIDAPPHVLSSWLDERAAASIRALPDTATPRKTPPLPVFGYPGWLPQSAEQGFYADQRWFRTAPANRESSAKLEPRA